MTRWISAALLVLAAALAGCGGNSTRAGIVISAASAGVGASSVTVPVNGSEQFGATVTGISTTTVRWQVCMPSTTTAVLPTNCTTIPGVTPPKGDTVLTGYGTINQNGFYTAPSSVPNPNSFWIVATSPVDTTAFGFFIVTIDSGVRVQVTPSTATIGASETQQFTATVTGAANTSVTWEVNGQTPGDATTGTISASGLYTAPSSATTVSIKAISGADASASGAASVSILSSDPGLTSLQPQIAAQGSAQQEVYLSGSNFTTNGSVVVGGVPISNFVYLSSSLLRVPIPAAQLANAAATIPIKFEFASGAQSPVENLTVVATRPAIASVTPQSLSTTSSSPTVAINGGYFSTGTPATTVQVNNLAPVAYSVQNSRQLSVTLPSAVTSVPGLYPLVVGNPGAASSGQPTMSAVNVAITPGSNSIPTAPNSTISLGAGSGPSAIAMDEADGLAIVAEKNANSVALINTTTNSIQSTISVGTAPSGVAVDDTLPHHLALVVNSGANSVSVIDLVTNAVTTISLSGFTPTAPSSSFPVAIGINPQTHRAIVANASTNVATIIDLVNTTSSCNTAPCPLMTIGGSQSGYGTGANPQIAIDPALNWALVTPGGAGTINIVDLGFGDPRPGSAGRAPAVVGSLSISTTMQGVAINPETHVALLTDSFSGAVSTFSLLNNSVNAVTNNGVALTGLGAVAAAANPLENVGIAVNNTTGDASVIDLSNHTVLQTVVGATGTAGTPSAVAVDPATNKAFTTNGAAGTVSVTSLVSSSTAVNPLQITESSPSVVFASAGQVTLTITGMGFTAGSSVLLDNTALTSGVTVVSPRQITATIPANSPFLASARRIAVQVQNTGGVVSNVEPLTVVQAVTVGTAPAGVAVDPYIHLAVVTNSGSGNISLVSLASPSALAHSLGPVGLIGPALGAHLNPRAVALNPRIGAAVVANYDSNDLTLVDYSEINRATPYSLPSVAGCSTSTTCTGPAGIAFNPDANGFLVTDSNLGTAQSDVAFGSVVPATLSAQAGINSPVSPQAVDQTPGDLAVAPSFDPFDPINNPNPLLSYAAIASSSQTSVVDILNTASEQVVGRTNGLVQPAGVVYDSLNRMFLVSDSLNNNIFIVNPLSFVPIAIRGGFNPLSLAYNPQSSTIVTVDGANGTLSFLDYVCPPSNSAPACTAPQVRSTIGLVGSQVSSTAPLGPKEVDVDPLLNIAVVVDSENNRVLLIPMPN